jgi:type IV secretory pathway VirB3-like protein
MIELHNAMDIIFFGYILFITYRYGVQNSVSDSYYRLPRNLQWVFTLVTWGYALPAMIIGLDYTGNGLVFLSGAGIALVGAAPAFHKAEDGSKQSNMEHYAHMIGAFVGIIAMLIFLIAEGGWYLVLAFLLLSGGAYLLDRKKHIWWLEIFAYIAITIFYRIILKKIY